MPRRSRENSPSSKSMTKNAKAKQAALDLINLSSRAFGYDELKISISDVTDEHL